MSASPDQPVDAVPAESSRRRLLKGAVVMAAAAGAAALHADRADAANGAAILIGSATNAGTAPTGLSVTGTAAAYGFGVSDNGFVNPLITKPTMWVHAKGTNFNNAFEVRAEGSANGIYIFCGGTGQAMHAESFSATPTIEVIHPDGGGPAVSAEASFGGAAVRATGTAGSPAIVAIFDPVDAGASTVVDVQQKGGTGDAMHVRVLDATSVGASVVAIASKGTGVVAKSISGIGISGQGRVGGSFNGTSAQVRLNKSTAATHPASGTAGDLFVDKSGRLWYCKGTTSWKQLA